ncbi:hypothetical protein KAZ66_01705 [Candidatus Woesebacteria bacterium]|nr:hypothetical protein [Candidatus Woesebacteria bacterium]
MNKNIRNTTIFTLLLAVVFLNISIDAHAAEFADKETLSSHIGASAISHLQNSGDNAAFIENTQDESRQNVDSTNESSVTQNVNAVVNTGHNIAERNIAIGGNAGMITTGDAAVVTAAQLNSNENTTVLGNAGSNAMAVASLTNTGNDVNSSTNNDSTRLTAVQNNNKTTVIQNVNAAANTGENYAPRNISIGGQAGVIQTGNAYAGTSLLVAGNGNVALVGGESDGDGPGSGASVVMSSTGDRYRATNEFRNQSQTDIKNQNMLSVAQACYACTVDTGNNTSNRNINTKGDAGVIQTGNAFMAISASLQGNTNTVFRPFKAGNNMMSSSSKNTGANSSVSSNSQNSVQKDVKNLNNATISQDIDGYANTGYNEASRNIAIGGNAGVIDTGNAYIFTLLNESLNANASQ